MTLPEMTYDNKVKMICIKLREGIIHHTDVLNDGSLHCYIDEDIENKLLSIEILLPKSYKGKK